MSEIKYKNKHRSDAIIQWLSDHSLISRNALCKLVGYDTSNLMKVFDGKMAITAKYLDGFEKELESYGYKKP